MGGGQAQPALGSNGSCYALMERWLREGMVERAATIADAAEKIMESGVAFLQQGADHAV